MNREAMVDRADEVLTWIAEDNCEPTWGIREKAEKIVDAILPQVSTVEELEALPTRALVLKDFGSYAQTEEAGSLARAVRTLGHVFLPTKPMTVVWRPES